MGLTYWGETCGYKEGTTFIKRTRVRGPQAGTTYGLKVKVGPACGAEGIYGTGSKARCREHKNLE